MHFTHRITALALTAAAATGIAACSSNEAATKPAGADAAAEASTAPKKDASAADVFVPDPDAGTCSPADVSGFKAPAYVPAVHAPSACSDAQITAGITACYDQSSTQATCDTWIKANAACFACIETPSSAAAWGPLVNYSTPAVDAGIYYNIAGCLELAQGNTTCAKSSQYALACEFAACNPPVCDLSANDQAAYDAYNQCLTDAAAVPTCKAYEDAAGACLGGDAGPASVCTGDFNNDPAAFAALIGLFCK
jgi:hypothetical protein